MSNTITTIDFKYKWSAITVDVFSNLQDAKNFISDNFTTEPQTINKIGVQIIMSEHDTIPDDRFNVYESYSETNSSEYFYFAVKQ